MLQDSHARIHNYLRISLTDACNFRCLYCMPEDPSFMPSARLMTGNEIEQIATEFVKLGVTKIRLTGGEPLVRKDAAQIIHRLSKLPVELTLTSNGILVNEYMQTLLASGIRSLNISIDSLNPVRFAAITRRDVWQQVWDNIELLLAHQFHVKLNVVVMRGVNDDEINDFVALTKDLPLHVRFIEFMPFEGNQWQSNRVITQTEILEAIQVQYSSYKLHDELHDTAKKFQVFGFAGTYAIISTMSQPFCGGCNRLRLTADGKMKNCLFSQGEADLLTALRSGQDIVPIIKQNVKEKAKETGGQLLADFTQVDASSLYNRSMVKIGG